jgi:PAS domain S-box-containing protein
MATLLPPHQSLLLETAAELNALATVEEALPLFAERARALVGADTVSVISWNEALTVGRVCVAVGIGAERSGRLTYAEENTLPAHAIHSGKPQFGRAGQYGYIRAVEEQLRRLRSTLSLPILGGDHPLTLQAGWLEERSQEQLTSDALTLTQLATITGIARRTLGERHRQYERAQLEAVLDAAGDGILIEREGRWVANPAAQRILALPDENVPSEAELNSRQLDGTPIRPHDGLDERFRIRMTSLAGAELVLDGSCSSSPVRVIVFRDVTAEHQREYTNAQFLRSLLDTIPTAICVVERDSRRVLLTNRAFLTLVGRSENEVVGAEQLYPWWAEGESRIEHIEGERYSRVYRHSGGTPVPVEIVVHDLEDADGRVFAQMGVIADLSERRRFERQLVQSGKLAAIGELAAGVAHEVNNPLFAILGLVEFLLKDIESGTKSHERLQLIQSTALEIKEIVRSLLDFARESSDEHMVIALDDVIRETVKLVHKTTAGHGVDIVEELDGAPFLVEGSSNQLKQVFLNLIGNARQAMPNGGTIRISLTADAEAVTAVVRDDGPGILPEHLQRIFEPFYTTKRAQGGTGLGLSVSVGIAENHGGSLTAASPPGEGAAFTLRLPRHDA